MSMRIVLAELQNGRAPTEEELVTMASRMVSDCSPGQPVYDVLQYPEDDPDGLSGHGVCPGDIPKLLGHYGITAQATDDDTAAAGQLTTGLPALLTYLAEGRKVIVAVNSELLWGLDGDHDHGDHAVFVAAVDTDANVVYLGDTGGASTQGERVDVDAFEKAWKPSGHTMIVTSPPVGR